MDDKIIFQREKLRQKLVELIAALDTASESYDPEEALPLEDTQAALLAYALGKSVRDYSLALRERIEARGRERIAMSTGGNGGNDGI